MGRAGLYMETGINLLHVSAVHFFYQKEALKLLVNLSDNPQNFHSLMEFDVSSQ